MALNSTPNQPVLPSRRVVRGMEGMAVVLAVLIALMLHYLAARHYGRWDVSRGGIYSLSEKTHAVLDALDRDVQATIFFESGHELFRKVDTLLREYEYACPRFQVDRVDPDRDPGRTEELIQRFPVTERNVVIFHAGDRSKIVRAGEWADFEEAGPDGAYRRMTVFRGEALCTSAIHALTQDRRPRVLFLTGQGEKTLESTDPSRGLSTLGRLIRQDNIDVETRALAEGEWDSNRPDAWIIAGPRHRFPQPLLNRIEAWLDHNGAAIFLLDSRVQTGLEPILKRRGIHVGDTVVQDPARTVTGREVLVLQYDSRHPITRNMDGVTSVLYLPRSVEPSNDLQAEAADRPSVTRLVLTSHRSWAEQDYEKSPVVFDPGRDQPGPVSIAAAVEKRTVAGMDAPLQTERLVVFGDSSFVANGRLTGGNADLFLGALNWVLNREERIEISPRTVEQVSLPLSGSQRRVLGWLVLALLPGSAALVGVLVRWRRRR